MIRESHACSKQGQRKKWELEARVGRRPLSLQIALSA